jgi:hypothetical protein
LGEKQPFEREDLLAFQEKSATLGRQDERLFGAVSGDIGPDRGEIAVKGNPQVAHNGQRAGRKKKENQSIFDQILAIVFERQAPKSET